MCEPQVYTVAGGKNVPSWLSDKKKKALRKDEEYRRRQAGATSALLCLHRWHIIYMCVCNPVVFRLMLVAATSAGCSSNPESVEPGRLDLLSTCILACGFRRVELVQDFEFPAACQRIKVTPDEQYIFASGYHPPQMRCFDVNQLSMKFDRHFDSGKEAAALARRRVVCPARYWGSVDWPRLGSGACEGTAEPGLERGKHIGQHTLWAV